MVRRARPPVRRAPSPSAIQRRSVSARQSRSRPAPSRLTGRGSIVAGPTLGPGPIGMRSQCGGARPSLAIRMPAAATSAPSPARAPHDPAARRSSRPLRPPRGRTSLSEPCAALPSQAVMACVTACDGARYAAPVRRKSCAGAGLRPNALARCPTPLVAARTGPRVSPTEGRSSHRQPSAVPLACQTKRHDAVACDPHGAPQRMLPARTPHDGSAPPLARGSRASAGRGSTVAGPTLSRDCGSLQGPRCQCIGRTDCALAACGTGRRSAPHVRIGVGRMLTEHFCCCLSTAAHQKLLVAPSRRRGRSMLLFLSFRRVLGVVPRARRGASARGARAGEAAAAPERSRQAVPPDGARRVALLRKPPLGLGVSEEDPRVRAAPGA